MNFASEMNKPIFVSRNRQIQLCSASRALNEALANDTVIKATNSSNSDDVFVKAAAAVKLPKQVLVSVDESSSDELKELVTKRLEIDGAVSFEFLDGRKFTGREAAREVEQGSEIGRYFLEAETETLRILQDAFAKGELR